MRLRTKIISLSLICVFSVYIIVCTACLMEGWSLLVRVCLYCAGGVGIALGALFFIIKKNALLKTALVVMAIAAIVYTAFISVNIAAGLNNLETDTEKAEKLTEIIRSTGGWAMAVYVLVQILQVVILPLPAAVCYLPGVYIWKDELWLAVVLASVGVLIGAVICYVLGRFCGRRIVEWIAGKETTDKYADYLGRRGKVLFVIMQILPFFPDDILCMIAGLTRMNFWFFLVTMILVRPAVVAVYCYTLGGDIIPFSGWGIPVWIAIIVVCAVLAVLSFKYQEKIEGWLKSLFTRRGKSKKDNDIEEN